MRLRITFSKSGALRYTGHLDLHSLLERTTRRAGLPLAYTQGFHPGPRLQLASALPLGFIGNAEVVDMWINLPEGNSVQSYQGRLQKASPPGLVISSIEVVDEHAPALQTRVVSADYEVSLLEQVDLSSLEQTVANLLATESVLRVRRGKPYDLRPLIEALSIQNHGGTGEIRLHIRLAAREGATGRPEEVIDALGIPVEATRTVRTRLNFKE